ncbi:MAG: phosphodiester glycosidase family protein [Tidjanibacter sp.]|nr:phosphodiester glycosidase family protein [Tidjanibacter sp.]
MKRLQLLVALATLSTLTLTAQVYTPTEADSVAFANAEWKILHDKDGLTAKWAQINMFDSTQSISVVEYHQSDYKTIVVQAEEGERIRTSDLAERLGAAAAINGSYFVVKTVRPATYVRLNGEQIAAGERNEDYRVNGVVAVEPLDVFSHEHATCDTIDLKYKNLLAAGPMLMENGEMIDHGNAQGYGVQQRHPRSFIGYKTNGNVVMVTVDGRFPGQGDGVNLTEMSFVSKMLGMEESINLDGGGSATLWVEEYGICNHPSDNKTFDNGGERIVTNAIVAVRRNIWQRLGYAMSNFFR